MSRRIRIAVLLTAAAVVVAGSLALSMASGTGDCPTKNRVCPRLWDPVLCADGVVYDNPCFAVVLCAPKPCVSVED